MPKWLDSLFVSRIALKVSVAKLRVELSLYDGRFEAIEARVGDLADRFNRFQNREGMRAARAELEVHDTLAEEAASILARPGEPISSADVGKGVDPKKLELWRKRRLV